MEGEREKGREVDQLGGNQRGRRSRDAGSEKKVHEMQCGWRIIG